MNAKHVCWGPQPAWSSKKYNYRWDIIEHNSVVVITTTEGTERFDDGVPIFDTNSPNRFVGDARFTVDNIAPYDGGVWFRVTIYWSWWNWWRPLTLWTDIIVFDELRKSPTDIGRESQS